MPRIRFKALAVAALAVAGLTAAAATETPLSADAAPRRQACMAGVKSAAELNGVFGARPAGMSGSDYAHAYPLADGRVLWTFQDVFMGADDVLAGDAFAHNVGIVQNGTCFSLLTNRGPGTGDYVGGNLTTTRSRWFWPLDGEIGADKNLHIFYVEMRNPRHTGAAEGALPAMTWVATIRPSDMAVIRFAPAVDSGTRLYGWSVVSDAKYSYLYGHPYKQFVPGAYLGVDPVESPNTYLARVPRGALWATRPEYWTGKTWSADWRAARPVLRRGILNPMSVQYFGGKYVNVTKLDEWWGKEILVDVASAPQGPWKTVARVPTPGRCGSDCNTYSAQLLPWLDPTNKRMIVALSNNHWNMDGLLPSSFGWLYRTTFLNIALPPGVIIRPVATPIGHLDSAVAVKRNSIVVSGWTADASDPKAPVTVHVYVDGRVVKGAVANGARADVARVYPAYGANHGYKVTVPASRGRHQVCTWAIDLYGTKNPQLGCKTVTV